MNEIFRNPNKEKFFLIAGPCVIENEEITFLDSSMGNSDILSIGPHSFNSCLHLDQK